MRWHSLQTGIKYSAIGAQALWKSRQGQQAAQQYLKQALAEMPGVGTKLAQFLALRHQQEGEAPPVTWEAMPLGWVKAQIEEHIPELDACIEAIDDKPRVASLGQVHEVQLKDGRCLALKFQRPELAQHIASECQLLRQLARFGPPQQFQFDAEHWIRYLEAKLNEELDYQREAEQQENFRDSIDTQAIAVVIPKVYRQWCRPTILVQDFEPSSDLDTVARYWPLVARKQAFTQLISFFVSSLRRSHHLHVDLHPGNYGFRNALHRSDGLAFEAVMYDFGCLLQLDEGMAKHLEEMLERSRRGQKAGDLQDWQQLGFDPHKLRGFAGQLPAIWHELTWPLWAQQPVFLEQGDIASRLEELLGESRWWFRSAGPPWFLLLMRAWHGIAQAAQRLQVPIDCVAIWDQWGRAEARERPQPIITPSPVVPRVLARYLCVEVRDAMGEALVQLEMPALAIDDLEDLLPDETRLKLEQQGYDLAALKKKVQLSDYAAQEVFQSRTDEKSYRVYLKN